MNTFLNASSLGGLLARMPNGFRISGDRRNGRGCPERARLLVFGVSGANAHEVLQAI
jgi:hypothetical protein